MDMDKMNDGIENLLAKSGLLASVQPLMEQYGLPREILSGAALLVLVVIYLTIGALVMNLLAFFVPVEATLLLVGKRRRSIDENKRKTLFLYWVVFSAWNTWFDTLGSSLSVFYPLVKFAVLAYLYMNARSSALYMEYLADALPLGLGNELDMLMLGAKAALFQDASSGETKRQEKKENEKDQEQEQERKPKQDREHDDGDDDNNDDNELCERHAKVTIKNVTLPDETDGVLVVVTARPGADRPPTPAEKLTFKTRVAFGRSIDFNQTITLGPLPDWDGAFRIDVLEKPTFGEQKVLLSETFSFSSFQVCSTDDDPVDFTEICNDVQLSGSVVLLES